MNFTQNCSRYVALLLTVFSLGCQKSNSPDEKKYEWLTFEVMTQKSQEIYRYDSTEAAYKFEESHQTTSFRLTRESTGEQKSVSDMQVSVNSSQIEGKSNLLFSFDSVDPSNSKVTYDSDFKLRQNGMKIKANYSAQIAIDGDILSKLDAGETVRVEVTELGMEQLKIAMQKTSKEMIRANLPPEITADSIQIVRSSVGKISYEVSKDKIVSEQQPSLVVMRAKIPTHR